MNQPAHVAGTRTRRLTATVHWAIGKFKTRPELNAWLERYEKTNGYCRELRDILNVELGLWKDRTDLENHAVLVDNSIEFKKELGK